MRVTVRWRGVPVLVSTVQPDGDVDVNIGWFGRISVTVKTKKEPG